MTTKLSLRPGRRMTLPNDVAQELGVTDGDEFLIEIKGGSLTLHPALTIPRDEAYLFTSEWQSVLREAERELSEGEYVEFTNVDDLLADLKD